MTTTTLSPAPTTPAVLPDLGNGDALGDEILLSAASQEKVARVRAAGSRSGARQAHSARAWSVSGQVD